MLGYYKNSRFPLPGIVLLNPLWGQLFTARETNNNSDDRRTLYLALLEYSADESRRAVRKISLGRSMRTLMSSRLDELGYSESV